MRHVLTFIASDPNLADLARTVTRLTAHVAGMPIRFLSDSACDVELERALDDDTLRPVRALAYEKRIDVVMQPLLTREKKLLISDMDSTLIHQECIDELADCVGLRAHVSAITARAMNGELDFESALRERVALLKGLDTETLQKVFHERITLMQGAKPLVDTMKARGAHTVLVSGGFTFFTTRVAAALGFDVTEANVLQAHQNKLTGEVKQPILGSDAKRAALIRHAAEKRIPLSATLAVGDGANDLPMLLEAGLGVAYHAKPIVGAKARAAIHFNDLSALLYLQGIPKRDWIV